MSPSFTNGTDPNDETLVNENPLFTPQKLRIICVGAGFSGLTLAYKWKYEFQAQDYADLVIYEKNDAVGGTWLENRYPGAACDVPGHIYTFMFEPNPDWTEFYVSAPEILEYVRRTTRKYNLDERVQFRTKIVSSTWDEALGKWNVRLQRGDEFFDDQADILINATGFLNKWKWPDIQGLHSFGGKLVHSANWDPDLDWSNKKVAVIGNGSSAIQILPEVQKTAQSVTTYIRAKAWITANMCAEYTPDGDNFKYTDEQIEEFRKDPAKLKEYRKKIENTFNSYIFAFIRDSPFQAGFRAACEKAMREKLNHDELLCDRLIPEWDVGCRRITPGQGYLAALQEDNVKVNFDGIEKITPTGVLSSKGEEAEFDIIVCATGFDTSFKPFWEMKGRNGIDLGQQWKKRPYGYCGVAAPDMPNYWIFTGPNSPLGHGSIFSVLDAVAEYIMKWIERVATTGIKSVSVRQDATDDYNEYSQEVLKRMVWTAPCRSWYKAGTIDGPVTAMYAGSVPHHRELLKSFRIEDYNIEYRSRNRFRFFGTGFSQRDAKVLQGEPEDLSYYL